MFNIYIECNYYHYYNLICRGPVFFKHKVIAIIPALNEEFAIGSVVLSALNYVDDLIVVDDGSTDSTSDIAKAAGAKVIPHTVNKGKGAALRTGFQSISSVNGIVVTLDSDGQHMPSDIPRLIEPIVKGEADIVNGSRYLNQEEDSTPFYRRIGQTVLDKATNINTGLHLTDSQSGFRAFASYTLPVFNFKDDGFSVESGMLTDAARAGYRIKEIDIASRYDDSNGSIHKKNPVTHGIGVLVHLIHDMEFNRPLYYFGLPGLILVISGLILGLYFFGKYLNNEMTSLLPTVLAAMIGLGGLFMGFTGIILHSVSRLLERNTKR